jgi:hypothetical protein
VGFWLPKSDDEKAVFDVIDWLLTLDLKELVRDDEKNASDSL